jgi:hypothetical protein
MVAMVSSWTGALRRLAGDVLDVARGTGEEIDAVAAEQAADQEHLRITVWRLRHAFETASEGGYLHEVGVVVARGVRDGRVALLAWLDLLEEIVQISERRYGAQSGRGEFKAAQVKAAVRRLLQRSDARSAAFVDLLGPAVIDLTTGLCIDVTVTLLNTNDELWQAGAAEPGKVRLPLGTRVVARLLRILSFPLYWFSSRTPLDPQLYDEVDRIAQGAGSPLVLIDQILALGEWVAANREQTLALVDLVSTACDEVEYFQSLGTSELKREYALNLVIVTVEDAGLELSDTALDVADAVFGLMIDFVVGTNNKRGRYGHALG